MLPLDTTIELTDYNPAIKQTDSYLKITVEKLYRVTGNTAQVNGVIPDIILPEIEGLNSHKESDYPNVLRAANIDANKYYKPYPKMDISAMQAIAKNIIDTSSYLKKLNEYNQLVKKYSQPKDVQLNLKLALEENKKANDVMKDVDAPESNTAPFTIDNHSYELIRLKSDEELKEMNDQWKKHLSKDPQLHVVYQLLSSISK